MGLYYWSRTPKENADSYFVGVSMTLFWYNAHKKQEEMKNILSQMWAEVQKTKHTQNWFHNFTWALYFIVFFWTKQLFQINIDFEAIRMHCKRAINICMHFLPLLQSFHHIQCFFSKCYKRFIGMYATHLYLYYLCHVCVCLWFVIGFLFL